QTSRQLTKNKVVCETASFSIHHHPVFGTREETFMFIPERWLDPASKQLEKYIINFSSGSRTCLGMHLAMLEIYYVLPGMVRYFDIDLSERLEREGLTWIDRWLPLKQQEEVDFVLTLRDD